VKQVLLVNGEQHTVEVDPDMPLLFVLTDELQLDAPHFSCGMAQCGACTVMMGSQVIRSCVKPVGSVGGAPITTLQGLGTAEKPHAIQQAFNG
jgi:nicotinate dehydrogenase subunit A